jgi:hypothetical protein
LNNSKAGTSLRQALAALIDPSEKANTAMKKLGISFVTSSGDTKKMTDFIIELDRALEGLTAGEQQLALGQMFEVRALAGVTAALNRLDALGGSFDGLIENAELSGTAMVKAMQQQESAVNQTKTAVEAFKDAFLGTGDAMLERTEAMTSAMRRLGGIFGSITEGIAKGFVGATESSNTFFGSVSAGLVTLGGALLAGITGPISLIGIAIAGFLGGGAIFGALNKDMSDHSSLWAEIGAEIRASSEETNIFLGTFKNITGLASIIKDEFGEVGSELNNQLTRLKELESTVLSYQEAIRAAIQIQGQAAAGDEFEAAKQKVEELKSELLGVTKEINNVKNGIVDLAGADMIKFIDGIKDAKSSFVALDSSIKIVKDEIEEGIFDKLLGVDKFNKTSKAIVPFVDNLLRSIEEIQNIAGTQGVNFITDDEITRLQEADNILRESVVTILEAEAAIKELTFVRKEQELAVADAKMAYAEEKDALKELTTQYSEVTKKINELTSARFTNETKTLGIIKKINTEIKKQELASLGVADANMFISKALQLEVSDYDSLIGKIQDINSEMNTNTGAFKAWQDTIKQAIRSEVEAGQDLGRDVSDRVKTWQTALLGISGADIGGEGTSGLEDFVNKLQLAYDVHFGGMRDDVTTFLEEQRDRELGVFDTSSQLIEALGIEIEKRTSLSEQIETQEKAVSESFTDLTLKSDALAATISIITDEEENIINSVDAIADLATSADTFATGLVDAISDIKTGIDNFLTSGEEKISELIDERLGNVPTAQELIEEPDLVLDAGTQAEILRAQEGTALGGQRTRTDMGTQYNIENITVQANDSDEFTEDLKFNAGQ